jgi:zona occludens toxin
MITGIEGIPGSGKSYEAVAYHVLPALQAGRKVITNLPLNLESFAAIDPSYPGLIQIKHSPSPILGKWDASDIAVRPAFQPFHDGHTERQPDNVSTFGTVWDYYDEWRRTDGRGPLYVIDECHVALPKSGTSSQVVEWYKLHRHYNCDVVLLTQSFRDVSQSIAGLLGSLIRCRKADILGKKDRYVRKVFGGYRSNAAIQTDQRPYKSQYFPLYTSHTQGQSVAEAEAQDVSPFIVKFNRAKWIVLVFAVLFALYAFWPRKGTGLFGNRTPPTKPLSAKMGTVSPIPRSPASAASGVAAAASAPASAPAPPPKVDFGVLGDAKVSIQGEILGKHASQIVFAVSDGGKQLFNVTSDELERAGYTVELFGYCFGYLEYKDNRRPVICDAPVMETGAQDRPIAFDRATGRFSNDSNDSATPSVPTAAAAPAAEPDAVKMVAEAEPQPMVHHHVTPMRSLAN